ncbi:mercuric transporter MerT family protein [Pararhizobium sp. LjRoot238]|uniref:mercuric transporter MerT family protein n=1 Tax=Pararhizobium sp. LjRoot238 TaxID=3342293 RepID=UPI003F504C43
MPGALSRTNAAAVVGGLFGLGALAASSCCAVPLMLASLGAGTSFFGVLASMAAWRLPLLVVSGFAVAAGWFVWWRARCETGSTCATRRRPRKPFILLLASVIVLVAAGWGSLEPLLLQLVQPA